MSSQYDQADIAAAYGREPDGTCPEVKIEFPDWAPPLTVVGDGEPVEAPADPTGGATQAGVDEAAVAALSPLSWVTTQIARDGKWQDFSTTTFQAARQHIGRAMPRLWRAVNADGAVVVAPKER